MKPILSAAACCLAACSAVASDWSAPPAWPSLRKVFERVPAAPTSAQPQA